MSVCKNRSANSLGVSAQLYFKLNYLFNSTVL